MRNSSSLSAPRSLLFATVASFLLCIQTVVPALHAQSQPLCGDGTCTGEEKEYCDSDCYGTTCGDGVCAESEYGWCGGEPECRAQSCTDSDPNADPYVRGSVEADGKNRRYDYCLQGNLWQFQCYQESDGTSIYSRSYTACDHGCYLGACLREGEEPPQESDSVACTDTDGGWEPSVQGKMETSSGMKYVDYCQGNQWLFEHDCGTENDIAIEQERCSHTAPGGCRTLCPNGCKNGACIASTEETPDKSENSSVSEDQDEKKCMDSDVTENNEGFNVYVKGSNAIGTDYCINEIQLMEYRCFGFETPSLTGHLCANGCKNGACVPGLNGSFCTDSDVSVPYPHGGDPFRSGMTAVVGQNKTDGCVDEKTLEEYSCDGNTFAVSHYSCVNGCEEGACVWGGEEKNAVFLDGIRDRAEDRQPQTPTNFEKDVRTSEGVENRFRDTDPLTPEGIAANALAERAVIGGFPDGEFKGWRLVNRAEASKFLLNGIGTTIGQGKNNDRFSDVLEGEWYIPFVIRAAELGIITGDDGKATFRPADSVNTAEFLAMLTRAFHLQTGLPHEYKDVAEGDWYDQFAGIAWRYGLFADRGNILEPSQMLTRNEVAISLYVILQRPEEEKR
ncbi:MAG: S-layer homology domain-containing protein [Patescibacteria group bacterium]